MHVIYFYCHQFFSDPPIGRFFLSLSLSLTTNFSSKSILAPFLRTETLLRSYYLLSHGEMTLRHLGGAPSRLSTANRFVQHLLFLPTFFFLIFPLDFTSRIYLFELLEKISLMVGVTRMLNQKKYHIKWGRERIKIGEVNTGGLRALALVFQRRWTRFITRLRGILDSVYSAISRSRSLREYAIGRHRGLHRNREQCGFWVWAAGVIAVSLLLGVQEYYYPSAYPTLSVTPVHVSASVSFVAVSRAHPSTVGKNTAKKNRVEKSLPLPQRDSKSLGLERSYMRRRSF